MWARRSPWWWRETLAQALDGAEAVEVDYEVLPHVLHAQDAMAPGAPKVWDEVGDNIPVETWFGDRAATDRAFAAADHVVKMDFHIGRVTGVPLEPRAAVAHYDAETDRYTLYAGSGGAVRQKRELATVLGIAPERLRVLSYDVGGNFGTRNRVFVEFGLVLWAAHKLKRPVKYTATRSEAFLSDYQGRDLVSKVELALRARWPLPGHAGHQYQQCGGARGVVLAAEQRLRPDPGLLRHSGRHLAGDGGLHQHDADPSLSQLRPAGGDLCDRAADRPGRARARLRPHQAAAPQPDQARRHAVPQRRRHALRQRPLCGEHGLGDGDRRLEGLRAAPARSQEARQAARPRPRQLRGVLDRGAQRADALHGAAGRPRRRGDRHPAERPGPRDQLCPGGLRPARMCRSIPSRSSTAIPTW